MADILDDLRPYVDEDLALEVLQNAGDNTGEYYFISASDEIRGEALIVHRAKEGGLKIIEHVEEVSVDVLWNLGIFNFPYLFEPSDSVISSVQHGNIREGHLDQNEIDRAMALKADWGVGASEMNSSGVPHTNGGRLACAWAVNKISRLCFGLPIGGGLATAEMAKVLRRNHSSRSDPVAGSVVISPTVWVDGTRITGHVGILGGNGAIYSNSSSRARWEQNFTLSSWRTYYHESKGLSVEIFALNPKKFPIKNYLGW
ncbi:hypothetical protein [Citreimonas salinaria]|uniref:hypothetical protein n=1 Tax=Citreimonas salinaria TaxID=321339 RepID=UPI00115F9FBA|nr:hypothetical protein [Citreimonas salinaria]